MFLFLKLIVESYRFAIHAIKVNRLRTVLSLLGITIGIFAIVFVFTATGTLERQIRESIEEIGDDALFIQQWPWTFNDPDFAWWEYIKRPQPSIRELNEIQRRVKGAEAVAFMTSTSSSVKMKEKRMNGVQVMGTSEEFELIWSYDIQYGRAFTQSEFSSGKNVILIGAEIATQLFNTEDVVGREIKVFNRKAKIAGVFKREGKDDFGGSMDEVVVMPVNLYRKFKDIKRGGGNTIVVKAREGVSNEELTDELIGILRSVRRLKPQAKDNFAINETNILSEGIDAIFGIITLAGWLIGGFSLLVGGFGIANIMFVSVKERTNQIGIQKSLGAKRYFILSQFLIESVFLSLLGGIIGLLLTYLVSTIVRVSTEFEMTMVFGNVVFGMVVSIVIGLVSGILPANKASKLNPVDAIRTHF